MQVILLERVERLGTVGDVVKVKDGYARNFLFPKGKALRATNENKAAFEVRKAEIQKENDNRKVEAQKLVSKVEGVFVTLIQQASEDGRLFGSIRRRDIAASVLEATGLDLAREVVLLTTPIKEIGIHSVKLRLHADVVTEVKVNVARSESEAAIAKQEFLNPSAKKKGKNQQAAEEEAVDAAPAEEATDAEEAAE